MVLYIRTRGVTAAAVVAAAGVEGPAACMHVCRQAGRQAGRQADSLMPPREKHPEAGSSNSNSSSTACRSWS